MCWIQVLSCEFAASLLGNRIELNLTLMILIRFNTDGFDIEEND